MKIFDETIDQFLLRRADMLLHDILELAGAGILQDVLTRKRDRNSRQFRREFSIVEQFSRTRIEILIAGVTRIGPGFIVEQPFPDGWPGKGFETIFLLHQMENGVGIGHKFLIAF